MKKSREIRVTYECGHCGRTSGDYDGGYGTDVDGNVLCHPNAPDRPDCYTLVTLYKHPMNCKCEE